MFDNVPKNFYFTFIPAMLLGTLAIILLIMGVIPLYYLFGTFIMWVLCSGLGIAVGYHRVFSHKTHKLPTWKENIILFFATFAGQGASLFWVAVHRGYHHPYSDTERDIHSPVVHGKLHSFVGWQYQFTKNNFPVNLKYSVDLMRKKNHVWFHDHNLKVLWITTIVVALINWKFALACFWLTTMLGILQDNLVNVYGHTKSFISYRNFETKDNSQNNPLLGYLCWGQGWHNNHHYDPKSFDFGSGISHNNYEVDLCRIFLPFLGKQQA